MNVRNRVPMESERGRGARNVRVCQRMLIGIRELCVACPGGVQADPRIGIVIRARGRRRSWSGDRIERWMAGFGRLQGVETPASGFSKQLDSPGAGIVVEVVCSECARRDQQIVDAARHQGPDGRLPKIVSNTNVTTWTVERLRCTIRRVHPCREDPLVFGPRPVRSPDAPHRSTTACQNRLR